jgi:hypothetical protein
MTRILKRRVALLLIALLAFAQGGIAFAACSMERGTMAHMAADEPCADAGTAASNAPAENANLCVAHCNADLQIGGITLPLVSAPAALPVLAVPRPEAVFFPTGLDAPPSGAPPHRILLHSFLI